MADETAKVRTTEELLAIIHKDEKKFPRALREAIGFRRVLDLNQAEGSASAVFEAPVALTHSNGTTVQGGIVTAWLDHTMAWAVAARDLNVSLASLEIKVSFLSRVGLHPSIAHARVLRWGRTTVFLEATLTNEEGKLLATASSVGLRG